MPIAFKSNQDFYDYVDSTIESLRSNGFARDANLLHHLLHKVAWNFVSELCAELGFALLDAAEKPLPTNVGAQVQSCIEWVEKFWPDIRVWHGRRQQTDGR